ncbi:HAMP domain-containing sensor histidine kinase [Cohnella fermenti]|uniref:histidine kinase n=1 Tax=Cohnella fermenti TaxID=2565925 RepID=A0A4S4BQC4_9BACL|nr:HAMP domain-containing sensor histidine kinase [Cohnella fermenti]THF77138.1 HAMP domain-containing histidine kinase [Cohnella fermenti]
MSDTIRRRSLLRYWSVRYFLLLLAGMAVVGGSVLGYLQVDAVARQKQGATGLVRDVATAAAANGGRIPGNPSAGRWLSERVNQYNLDIRPIVLIFDPQGQVISQFPPVPPPEMEYLRYDLQDVLNDEPRLFTIRSALDGTVYQAATYPVSESSRTIGYVLYLTPRVDIVQGILEFKVLIFLLFAFVLAGWAAIYVMTRRVVQPIRQAADAANQMITGNYSLQFAREYREQEMVELMESFQELADKLNRLESLRSQLLAGVTHELKTPVTSISGLIQAVKGQVVSGDEADMFLEVCLKESVRLQKMIEDLLDFNSFADSTIAAVNDRCELNRVLAGIVERWRMGQGRSELEVILELPEREEGWSVRTDPGRIEQIMINLLNNARDASAPAGTVSIRLAAAPDAFHIRIHDTGKGIPAAEQAEIFEPFYRGNNKKTRVRGLGIGLTFSRMIARSLGGDLVLSDSSPGSTTFTLTVPSS